MRTSLARRTKKGLKDDRLRLMVESAREYAIFSLDLERRVTTWNSGAERLLGYPGKEILGHSADIVFTAEDLRRLPLLGASLG